MVARRAHNPEVGGPSPPSATKQAVNPNGWPLIVFPAHVSSHHIQQPITHLFKYRNSETNLQIQLALQHLREQKPRFCARNARKQVSRRQQAQQRRCCARKSRKRGFRTPKKHKNPVGVPEKPENGGSEGQKRTKTSILCSKCPKLGVPKAKSAQKPHFCARGDGKVASESITAETFIVNISFEQITARVSKMQIPHNLIINSYQRAR